jgi:3-hydroxyisobutyrate dehydrogenase-like beta-hydroxyacid dehydrogenase
MACKLLKSDLAVTVYNRTRSHAEALNLDWTAIELVTAGDAGLRTIAAQD